VGPILHAPFSSRRPTSRSDRFFPFRFSIVFFFPCPLVLCASSHVDVSFHDVEKSRERPLGHFPTLPGALFRGSKRCSSAQTGGRARANCLAATWRPAPRCARRKLGRLLLSGSPPKKKPPRVPGTKTFSTHSVPHAHSQFRSPPSSRWQWALELSRAKAYMSRNSSPLVGNPLETVPPQTAPGNPPVQIVRRHIERRFLIRETTGRRSSLSELFFFCVFGRSGRLGCGFAVSCSTDCLIHQDHPPA